LIEGFPANERNHRNDRNDMGSKRRESASDPASTLAEDRHRASNEQEVQ
jgi:hypothetical protein